MISVEQLRRKSPRRRYVGRFGDKSKLCRGLMIARKHARAVASGARAV
jgi:hypothetical protein